MNMRQRFARFFSTGSRNVFAGSTSLPYAQANVKYEALINAGVKSNATVYAAIKLIARSISEIPLIVYREVGKERKEVGAEHPLQQTLDRPNRLYGRMRMIEAIFTDILTAGSSFALDANYGMASQVRHTLIRLRPDWVELKLDDSGELTNYLYRRGGQESKAVLYEPDKVFRSWLIDPLNDTVGLAPLRVCSASVAMANESLIWNLSLMRNQGKPPFIVSAKQDQPLAEEELKRMREDFERFVAGYGNAGKPWFTGNAAVKVQNVTVNPADLDWIEGIKLTTRNVSTAFFVPSVLLNDTENATYSNMKSALRIFYTITVLPLLNMVCGDLTSFFEPMFGGGNIVGFDRDKIEALQEERSEKWDRVDKCNFLTVNEKREELGWTPDPNPAAGVLFMPSNLIPLSDEEPDDTPDVAIGEESNGRSATRPFEQSAQTVQARARKERRYWIAFERRRSAWRPVVKGIVEKEFRAEMAEVKTAVEASGSQPGIAADSALESRKDEWAKALQGVYRRVANDFGGVVYEALKKERAAAEPWSAYIVPWVETNAAKQVKHISETTRSQVRDTLAEGVAGGEHAALLTARIDALYLQQIIPNRSRTIARTEIVAASNLGSQAGARATGLPLKKSWLSTPDARTRESHSLANGQEREMNEPYVVDGEELMFPGDSSMTASAGNVANCRCTETYSVKSRE